MVLTAKVGHQPKNHQKVCLKETSLIRQKVPSPLKALKAQDAQEALEALEAQ